MPSTSCAYPFFPLHRFDRLQLPLFPEGHPRGVWGGRVHPAAFRLPGGWLAMWQGAKRHAVQQRLDSEADHFNPKTERRKEQWKMVERTGRSERTDWSELHRGSLAPPITSPLIPAPWSTDGLLGPRDGRTAVRLVEAEDEGKLVSGETRWNEMNEREHGGKVWICFWVRWGSIGGCDTELLDLSRNTETQWKKQSRSGQTVMSLIRNLSRWWTSRTTSALKRQTCANTHTRAHTHTYTKKN